MLAERSESVTLAFLVLLETLSPEERAVFLLKEVFEYEHLQIADMLGTTAANSRQLFHRAKSKIKRAPRDGVAPIVRLPNDLRWRFRTVTWTACAPSSRPMWVS